MEAVPLGAAALPAWLDELEAVLAEGADVDVRGLSDGALLAAVGRLGAAGSRIAAVKLAALAEADRRGAAKSAAGALSTGQWLRTQGVNPGAAAREVALAGSLERNQATRGALASGLISVEQAQVVAAAVDALSEAVPDDERAAAQARLIESAGRLDPVQLRKLAAAQAARIDPGGAGNLERGEQAAKANRELTVSRWSSDGMWHVNGRLDAEGAAHLQAALGPLAKPRPSTAQGQDMRTPARRLADALVQLATWAAAAKALPDSGGLKPQVMVLIDYPALAAQLPGAGTITAGPLAEPISAAAARRIACDAGILPAVLGSAGQVLDLGRDQRNATDAQRKALTARDRGCAFPGCDRPMAWADAHHITHWADGGATDLDNLVMLCGPHHDTVHHHGWTITMDDGRPAFHPPPTPPPEPPWPEPPWPEPSGPD